MKNSVLYLFTIISIIVANSCKKDDGDKTKISKYSYSPTCAYTSTEPIGNGLYGTFLYFFDLRSSNTVDKKYFKLQLKYQGFRDSFEIVTSTQSVNSIASNFPPEITKAPGYGAVNQWTNPEYRLLSYNGAYYKDTIPRNPQSNIYFLYQNFLSGSLKDVWPQSHFVHYNVPTGIDGQNTYYNLGIFYFSVGAIYFPYTNEIKSLRSFYKGAPNAYDWEEIDAAIQISVNAGVGVAACNFYFFDFKNWRYFVWEQHGFPISANNFELATTFKDDQSLDNFCVWPEGWGKP